MGKCKKCLDKYGEGMYVLARLLAGLFFFMHGWGKFASGASGSSSVMLIAAILEVLIGAAIFLGLFTRLAAFGGAIVMLVAFFWKHFPQGWNPLANGGELALMFFVVFLLMIKLGNGKWSLEQQLMKKETF